MSTPDIVERLREFASRICTVRADTDLNNKAVLARSAAEAIERLTAERDEARRLVCSAYAMQGRDIATERGWDCLKEER